MKQYQSMLILAYCRQSRWFSEGISNVYSMHLRPPLYINHIFGYLMQMTQPLLRSFKTPNTIHISLMPLAPSMVPIFLATLTVKSAMLLTIAKVPWPRTALLPVHSICHFSMSWAVGRGQWPMLMCTTMHGSKISISPLENIILQMQDSEPVMSYSYHIAMCATT